MADLAYTERSHKKILTGRPGLMLNRVFHRGKYQYRFLLRVPNHKPKTVHIGSEDTWLANYEITLERATALIDQLRAEEL